MLRTYNCDAGNALAALRAAFKHYLKHYVTHYTTRYIHRANAQNLTNNKGEAAQKVKIHTQD